jgi:PKD repeat protein
LQRSDAGLVKGAGTVQVVAGTGGIGLYDVNASDTEAGYFDAMSGANSNPTWGALEVSATQDSLQASFVRAAGGTFSDSFTISKDITSPNSPPSASFTSSCNDLSCTLDGSGSSDSDGSVTSYAWTFCDDSTGTGIMPAHSYVAAGTYTVGLTVTDDDGATDTTTRSVTVTAPTGTTYASDNFSRTVSSGFGTAPIGGPWTLSGSSSLFSVADGVGVIRVGAGSGPAAYLSNVSAADTDLRMTFSLDKQPTGNGLYLSTFLRRGSGGSYFAKSRVDSTGGVWVELCRRPASGSEVSLGTAVKVSGLTYSAGDTLQLRLQAVGSSPTTLRAKVWKQGTTEPTTWQRSVTDSTAGLQIAGSVGVSPYLSSGATNAPVTVKIDDLAVTSP